MSEYIFHAPDTFRENAWIKSMDEYKAEYLRSVEDPDEFWGDIARQFYWEKGWDRVREFNYSISRGPVYLEWFTNARTNMTYNCIDRHLPSRSDQPALIWEGSLPGDDLVVTYRDLHANVCRFANALKARGVGKGDRVAVYLPMVPELAVTMLACARIGAVHVILSGGLSAQALAVRLVDAVCKALVTSDGANRGAKIAPLKSNADQALDICQRRGHIIETCFVVRRTGGKVKMTGGRDVWWYEAVQNQSFECPVVWMEAEDPLFILYTSDLIDAACGVQHNVGGYMVYAGTTFKYIFDYHDKDIFWCASDTGCVAGHSYTVYGPLSLGGTSVMFEGLPTYPDPGRLWAVVEKWQVTQFYTTPTAIQVLMAEDEKWVQAHDLSSLRILGTMGEPIHPDAWQWYHKHVGQKRCPVVDTWYQAETGGVMLSALPYAIDQKPGSSALPFFSVQPVLLSEQGRELSGACDGILAVKEPWPGQMRTVYKNHDRFEKKYFQRFDGYYFSGDRCRRDKDGYFWITGRV